MNRHTVYLMICGIFLLSACTSTNIRFDTLTCLENFQSQRVIDMFNPGPDDNHGLLLNVSFTFPTAYRDSEMLKEMQYEITRTMFGEDYSDLEPKAAFDKYIEDNLIDYITTVDECIDSFDKMEGGLFCWSIDLKDSIYFENRELVQFYSNIYTYMGGAHGGTGYASILFDLKNKKILTSGDIFQEEAEVLRDLLMEEYIKYSPEIADDEETFQLVRNNIWNDQTDFTISAEGIYFNYNSYELGFYALGSPRLFIPYSKLKESILPDSPVYLLLR